MNSFDIVFLAEPNFSGGTSTSLASEIRAAQRAGLKCAIRFIRTRQLGPQCVPNANVLDAIHGSEIHILEARSVVHARLLLICHPYILNHPVNKPLGVTADVAAVIAHHPPEDRSGETQYDLSRLRAQIKDLLGKDLIVLPVSQTVRRSFEQIGEGASLWAHDWSNLIDTEYWAPVELEYTGGAFRIGRHSRPSLLKWPEPDKLALVYPETSEFEFHMLGLPPDIDKRIPSWPSNWYGRSFSAGGSKPFLERLHAYSYYHSNVWIEAFGYNVLESMALGLPTVLPPHFEEIFQSGGTYAAPEQAVDVYRRLKTDKGYRDDRSDAARQFVEANFGLDRYTERVERLVGYETVTSTTRRPAASDRVLVVTSNGVGVGHISRQLAIASEQPLGVQTLFFTLSRSAKFAERAGYVVEHRAYHRQINAKPELWNKWFAEELKEALAFYQPDVVVFDGNVPYQGLMDALDAFPEIARVWTRRGMWRHEDSSAIARAKWFDVVLEPQDIAETQANQFDSHAVVKSVKVPSIVSVAPEKCLSRESARKILNLDTDAEVALLQLGASTNFDMTLAREIALDVLLADRRRTVVELLSPARLKTSPVSSDRHLQVTDYPFFRLHRAFDMVVSACGYNSFHEVLAGKLPCLFVPNDAPEMDLQEARAEYARASGWSSCARADKPYVLRARLERFCSDSDQRQSMIEKMTAADFKFEGALEAAKHVLMTARTIQLRARP